MKQKTGKRNIQQSKHNAMQGINSNVRLLVEVFGLAVEQDAGSEIAEIAQLYKETGSIPQAIEEVKFERRQLALFEVDCL